MWILIMFISDFIGILYYYNFLNSALLYAQNKKLLDMTITKKQRAVYNNNIMPAC